MTDLALRNARLVFPHRGVVEGEVAISNGRIEAVGKDLGPADRSVDVGGAFVGPGIVDPHTHLGIYRKAEEDALSESKCALRGGVTSLVTYWRAGEPYTPGLVPYSEGFPSFLSQLSGRMSCDYAVNLGILSRTHLSEVEDLVRNRGVTTLKYFSHYEGRKDLGPDLHTGTLWRLAQKVAELAKSVPATRLSVHCEEAALVREATEEIQAAAGGADLEAYRRSRPELAEVLSIARLGELSRATGAPSYLPHVSSADGLKEASRFVEEGVPLVVETSLHYLLLDASSPAGILAKVNPPLRRPADREALWEGLARGRIRCVGSDHACDFRADKRELWSAKPAFPGTGLLLPLLFEEGVMRRKVLTPEGLWGILSENNARAHGLHPRKGSLVPGADADLVVLAKGPERSLRAEDVGSASDFTPYEGHPVRYRPSQVYLRGELVWDGEGFPGPGRGEYLSRPLTLDSLAGPAAGRP